MKRSLKKSKLIRCSLMKSTALVGVLLLGLMSCKKEELTFDQDNAFIAFQDASGSISEGATEALTFELYYASRSTGNVSVTLEFDATGMDNPAVEGVDFTVLSSKTISFDNNLVQVVEIEAIDNDLRDRNRSVNITLTSNGDTPIGKGTGVNGTYLLTIIDNEHPLSRWIGSYSVEADSYGDVIEGELDGAWDEVWEVTTSPVDDDETVLEVVGIALGDLPVIASFDLESMTITLPSGANTGDGYGYGPAVIAKGNYETIEETDVVGTINEDGTIAVDQLTLLLPDYGSFVWDSFNTTWTHVKKKAAFRAERIIDKMSK